MERLWHDPVPAGPAGSARPARTSVGRRLRGDRGAIMLSSLVKFVLVIGLLGVVAYDGFSIARVQVTVRDDAQQAAQIAHDAINDRLTPAQAYQKAETYAKSRGATIVKGGFAITKDGTVTLSLTETAQTFVAGRVAALDSYVTPVATVTASNSTY